MEQYLLNYNKQSSSIEELPLIDQLIIETIKRDLVMTDDQYVSLRSRFQRDRNQFDFSDAALIKKRKRHVQTIEEPDVTSQITTRSKRMTYNPNRNMKGKFCRAKESQTTKVVVKKSLRLQEKSKPDGDN